MYLKKMKINLRPFRLALRAVLKPFNYVVLHKKETIDFYLHKYSSYEEYRDVQVFHNKQKIHNVWADKATLDRVANILMNSFEGNRKIKGICHGTRNGFEQNYLRTLSEKIEAIGTDISETALNYKNSVQWDFHDKKDEWNLANDFVYTNSLDQSWQPKAAILTWLSQLNDDGLLIIEHTEAHGPKGASDGDPFGVRPNVMPYVLTMWFGSQISISHSVAKKDNLDLDAWLFVISKKVKEVVAIDEG